LLKLRSGGWIVYEHTLCAEGRTGGVSPRTYGILARPRRWGRYRLSAHKKWIMKRQRKEKGCFLILLFLDEKKQKSSDYIIC
jgi:hypothetical protein